MVRHERHVLVALAVGELVHPDGGEAIERVLGPMPPNHSLDDLAHGHPGDPEHLQHRRLVGALSQEGHRFLEGVGETGLGAIAPGDFLHMDATNRAGDSAPCVAQQHLRAGEVQVPPEANRKAVVAWDDAVAYGAPGPPPGGMDIHHQSQPVEPEVVDHEVLYSKQFLE